MFEIMRYPRVNETTRGEIKTLADLYDATIRDTDEKRAVREAADKNTRGELKRAIPCWYAGGTMVGPARAENARPAGVLQIDIDADDTLDRLTELKSRLAAIDSVAFAAISASGRGAYALMRVPVDVQRDQDAQKEILGYIDAAILYDRLPGEHIDLGCVDLARRRFESYDPEPVYRPDATEYEPDFAGMCRRAFDASGLAQIARDLCGEATPGGASTCAALAALAVRARGRVKGRIFGDTYYATRFQGVILGESGSGKSTTMKDPLEDLAFKIGANLIQPESHRALELAIVESCTTKSYQVGENGKPDKEKPIWTQIPDYTPLLAVYDEAGAEQEARKTQEYKKKMEAVRRQAFDATFKAAKSINTPLPTFPLQCSYTDVRISTPKAWAAALAGSDATVGDGRRVLEFWLDTPSAPDGSLCQPLAQAMFRMKNKPRPAGVSAVMGYMDFVLADGELFLDGRHSVSDLDTVRGLQATGCSQDYATIICNLATAIAYAGGCSEDIPRDAILAAWAVYLGVLENRRRLAESADVAPQTLEGQITAFILNYIGSRGTVRKSQIKRMLTCKGETYLRAYDALAKRGAVVIIGGKSATVRLATEAEMESAEATTGPDFSEERANLPKCKHASSHRASTPYADCPDAEREERVRSYIYQYRLDHPLIEGTRNIALWDLRVLLQRRNGMWDDVAQALFRETAFSAGLPDREVSLLMRANIDGPRPV